MNDKRVCRYCCGWGKWTVPSTHQIYGQTCAPCGGTGYEASAEVTALRWQLHGLDQEAKRRGQ